MMVNVHQGQPVGVEMVETPQPRQPARRLELVAQPRQPVELVARLERLAPAVRQARHWAVVEQMVEMAVLAVARKRWLAAMEERPWPQPVQDQGRAVAASQQRPVEREAQRQVAALEAPVVPVRPVMLETAATRRRRF